MELEELEFTEIIYDDLICNIIRHIGYIDIIRFSMTCKTIYEMPKNYRLWAFIIKEKYPHAYSVIMTFIDQEEPFDMWFYFYENMEKNQQFINYYISGSNDINNNITESQNISKSYVGMVKSTNKLKQAFVNNQEFIFILIANDKDYKHNKLILYYIFYFNIIDKSTYFLFLDQITEEDNYESTIIDHYNNIKNKENIAKTLLKSIHVRKYLELYTLAIDLINKDKFELSIFIYENYLTHIEKIKYYEKYKNMPIIGSLMDPYNQFKQIEYVNDIDNFIFNMPIYLFNKITKNNADIEFNRYKNMDSYKNIKIVLLQHIYNIIKYKYQIEELITKHIDDVIIYFDDGIVNINNNIVYDSIIIECTHNISFKFRYLINSTAIAYLDVHVLKKIIIYQTDLKNINIYLDYNDSALYVYI